MEFIGWPKTPRLFRDAIITEKIDGTNACVVIETATDDMPYMMPGTLALTGDAEGLPCWVGAQSRTRIITPEADNFGFAAWVQANARVLARALGPGRHFGEWWGHGIQRGYGLAPGDRRFSLFNTSRKFPGDLSTVPGLGLVPVLDQCTFNTDYVHGCLDWLVRQGSHAARGFRNPEGVVVYHTASGAVFKALIEADDKPKGALAA